VAAQLQVMMYLWTSPFH